MKNQITIAREALNDIPSRTGEQYRQLSKLGLPNGTIDYLYRNDEIDSQDYEMFLCERVRGMKYGSKIAQRILDKSSDWSGRWPIIENGDAPPPHSDDDGYAIWDKKRPALYYTGGISEGENDMANVDDMAMIGFSDRVNSHA